MSDYNLASFSQVAADGNMVGYVAAFAPFVGDYANLQNYGKPNAF